MPLIFCGGTGISENFLRLSASSVFQISSAKMTSNFLSCIPNISSATGSRYLNTPPSCTSKGSFSKRADAPYRSDRTEAWLKVKTVQKGKFPVIGFVKDLTGVAALYLGKREGKDLVYMGKVGTGWSRTVSSQIRKQLDTVVSPISKLTKQIKKPKATWVEPKFFADVEYRDITSEGLLRASSFKGLSRNDKS